MGRTIFLVEEPSMDAMLRGLLPRIFPNWIEETDWLCVVHEGKSALEKAIPGKLRAWREPGIRFVVLRDKDSADCHNVKQKLINLCTEGGRPDSLIRIPCHELEAWYLGDLASVAAAFDAPSIAGQQNTAKFRDPDRLANATEELRRLVPQYGKVSGSRKLGGLLDIEANRSYSFRVFVHGLRAFVTAEEVTL